MVIHGRVDAAALDKRRYDERRHSYAQTPKVERRLGGDVLIGRGHAGGWRHGIVEAAMFVKKDEQHTVFPVGARDEAVVELSEQRFSISDVMGRMLIGCRTQGIFEVFGLDE